MKTETVSGKIESAYGTKLKEVLTFEGKYEEFTIPDDAASTALTFDSPDGADKITDVITYGDLYGMVNAKRRANRRQKAMNEALDKAGIKKPELKDNPQLQLKQMIAVFVANGRDEETAISLAEAALNLTYDR